MPPLPQAAAPLLATLLILGTLPSPTHAASPHVGADATLTMPPLPSIHIDHDDAFKDHPAVREGQGTPSDPYRITNWTLLPTHAATLHLQNTTAHVQLKNLYLPGHPAGLLDCQEPPTACDTTLIRLNNATNVTIQNVHGHTAHTGIHLQNTDNVHLETIALTPTQTAPPPATGIHTHHATNTTVRNATLQGTPHALSIDRSGHTTITDTTLQGTPQAPAKTTLQNSHNVTIQRTHTDHHTFQLASPEPPRAPTLEPTLTDITIQRNHIQNTTHVPIDKDDETPQRLTICGNTLTNLTAHTAIHLWHGQDLTIENNHIHNVTGQAMSLDGTNVNVTNNLIHDVHDGDAGLTLHAPLATLTGNSFSTMAPITILGDGTDATTNWWGHPSGPSGINTNGDGVLLIPHGDNVHVEPWKETPPSTVGPSSANCGQDKPPGAKQTPHLTATIHLEATLTLSEQHSHATTQADARAQTPLPP